MALSIWNQLGPGRGSTRGAETHMQIALLVSVGGVRFAAMGGALGAVCSGYGLHAKAKPINCPHPHAPTSIVHLTRAHTMNGDSGRTEGLGSPSHHVGGAPLFKSNMLVRGKGGRTPDARSLRVHAAHNPFAQASTLRQHRGSCRRWYPGCTLEWRRLPLGSTNGRPLTPQASPSEFDSMCHHSA